MGPGGVEGAVGAVQIASSVENYKSGFLVSWLGTDQAYKSGFVA